jgi:hypothetical protein
MQRYEFKVIPAPRRGEKARGVKTTEDRFALALSGLMNSLGAEGWDYVRADTLPVDERSGLTGTKTTFHSMLVFRSPRAARRLLCQKSPFLSPRAGSVRRMWHRGARRPLVRPARTLLQNRAFSPQLRPRPVAMLRQRRPARFCRPH